MKKILWMLAAIGGMAVCMADDGGSCKNCGSPTKHLSIYRCNKCRKFFCANCREGDKVEHTDNEAIRNLNKLNDLMNVLDHGGRVIICPECGNKDKLIDCKFEKGNIRLIKE